MTDQEIDEAVARKLGRKPVPSGVNCLCGSFEACYHGTRIPPYSTSIEWAWTIVEKYKLGVYWQYDLWWCSQWGDWERGLGSADTAPMAICLAYLKLS